AVGSMLSIRFESPMTVQGDAHSRSKPPIVLARIVLRISALPGVNAFVPTRPFDEKRVAMSRASGPSVRPASTVESLVEAVARVPVARLLTANALVLSRHLARSSTIFDAARTRDLRTGTAKLAMETPPRPVFPVIVLLNSVAPP